MLRYILRRLYWFIPVFFLVLVLLFILDQKTAADQFFQSNTTYRQQDQPFGKELQLLQETAASKGWNLPPFYFGWHHRGWTSEFYEEIDAHTRNSLEQIGKWTLDANFSRDIHSSIIKLQENYRYEGRDDMYKSRFLELSTPQNMDSLWPWLQAMGNERVENEHLKLLVEQVNQVGSQKTIFHALPKFSWHGSQNRFHLFMKNYLFKGNQYSVVDGIAVYKKIWPAAGITVFINIISLVILTLISLPLGLYLFRNENRLKARITQLLLYILFALPLFWLATFVLLTAAGIPGLNMTGMPVLKTAEVPTIMTFLRPQNWSYLILPIISIVLGLMAFF